MRFQDLQTSPTPGPGRAFRRVALAATLAAAAMLPAAPAAASELLIFHVYVAGPNGGTIVVDDGHTVPDGTCGIRVQDPEAWYWAEGDYGEVGELDIPNNGDSVNEIEISGAFEGCEQTPYNAVTPATPAGWPPEDAISLVIQAWSDDVEYLDYNTDPLPAPDEGDPDHVWQGICEEVPDFCEEEPEITIMPFCVAFPELCSPFEGAGLGLVQAGDLANSASYQLRRSQRLLAPPANRPAALAALNLARKRAGFAAEALRALRQQDDQLEGALGASSHRLPTTFAIADRASGRIELGNAWTGRCLQALDAARRRLVAGGTPVLTSALTSCDQVSELIAGGRAASDVLRAWAVPAEQQR